MMPEAELDADLAPLPKFKDIPWKHIVLSGLTALCGTRVDYTAPCGTIKMRMCPDCARIWNRK